MSIAKIKKILEIDSDPKNAIFEIYETIVDIKDKVKGDKGDQGNAGNDGKDGSNGIDGKRGKTGLQGNNGLVGLSGVDGMDGLDGEKGDTGEKGDIGNIPKHQWKGTWIRFENPDGEWGKWVNLQGVEGMRGRGGRIFGSGNSNQNFNELLRVDLSDQCDGVTKTFNMPHYKGSSVTLQSTQFPIIYRPVVDFTEDGIVAVNQATITLTDEVGAPQTGQTLVALYAKL